MNMRALYLAILIPISVSLAAARAQSDAVEELRQEMQRQNEGLRHRVDQLSRQIEGAHPAPVIIADHSVTQAIFNVLNNAAEASPDAVSIAARWSDQILDIEIRDRGAGLDSGLRAIIGKNPVPTGGTKDGLGIGVFLSKAIVDRLGGRLKLDDVDDGGVCARIELPLRALRTDTSS